jgi:F1F0 ATPase subunit 2
MLVGLAMDAQAMTPPYPPSLDLITPAQSVGAWLAFGLLVGAFYFLTLRWTVRMFAAARPLLLPLGLQLIRFGLIAVILATITWSFGALPLLMATMGILIMRTIIVRLGAPP